MEAWWSVSSRSRSPTWSSGGTTTQTAGATLVSDIAGALGFLKITGNLKEALLLVTGGVDGKVGPVTIGGSLIGGADDGSGQIFTDGLIGAVKIGRDLVGGSTQTTGSVISGGSLAAITLGGSLIGGRASDTGLI